MKNFLIYISFVVFGWTAKAQQTPFFVLHQANPYVLNPAYAGFNSEVRGFLHYRNSMQGLRGAPVTNLLSVDAPISKYNMGLGAQVFVDKVNVLGRRGGNLSYSYKLQLPAESQLYFGVSLGLVANSIIYDEIVAGSPSELLKLHNYKPFKSFNSDFGVIYTIKGMTFSFAATNIANRKNFKDAYQLPYQQNPIYNIGIDYQFALSDKLIAKPSVVARSSQGLPFAFDINGVVEWDNFIWGGFNYSYQASAGAIIGVNYDNLVMAYAYGYPVSELANVSNGSHELVLGYKFGTPKRKKNNDQDILNGNQTNNTNNSKSNYDSKNSKSNNNKNQNNQNNQQQHRSDTTYHVIVFKDPDDFVRLRQSYISDQDELEEIIEQLKVKIDGDNTSPKDSSDMKNTKNPKGYYVVVAAYKRFNDAKAYQQMIQREAAQSSLLIQSKSGSLYFVATTRSDKKEEAIKELKKVRKSSVAKFAFGNIWIYGEE